MLEATICNASNTIYIINAKCIFHLHDLCIEAQKYTISYEHNTIPFNKYIDSIFIYNT